MKLNLRWDIGWQVVASGVDERTLKREGVCAASLPTTMVSADPWKLKHRSLAWVLHKYLLYIL